MSTKADSRGTVLRFASIVVGLVLWQFVIEVFRPAMLPSPLAVLERLLTELESGALLHHLSATLSRVAISFLLAVLLGLVLGVVMGSRRSLDQFLDGPLMVGLNIPALVVTILCFIWFGLNEFAVLLAVVLNKTPTMTVIFREGTRAIDPGLLEVARVHRLGPWRRFRYVWLPQLYPYFLAATRSGLALVWKIVLVVELLGASSGMGFKLGEFFQFFEIDAVLAYAFTFVVIIMGLEALVVRPWEARVMRWRES